MDVLSIDSFRGYYFFLSNFSSSKIQYKGYTYPNGEAAFQAQKNDSHTYKHLMQFQTPKSAKKEGRHVNLRSDWEQVKDQLMYEIVLAKFSQNEELKRRLLATGTKKLIEGNTWHDNEWGYCTCPRCKNETKQNKLGKILMRVREELK